MPATFILGASDPEMQAIEGLLQTVQQPFGYAVTLDGKRVHPGIAYAATHARRPDSDEWSPVTGPWIAVECGFPSACEPAHVIDHHRSGDPGYGIAPALFLSASSIGQTASLLARRGRLPWTGVAASETSGIASGKFMDLGGSWSVISERTKGCGEALLVPADVVFVAAADHCLAAAYAGRCPNVDPDALMRWRIASRAAFQRRDEATVLADVETTRAAIRALATPPVPGCGHGWSDDHAPDCPSVTGQPGRCFGARRAIVDLGDSTLPELPEAAAREGLGVIATVSERDGRRKLVLTGAAPADEIARWMDAQRDAGREVYGDAARGFAGAYLQ